MLLLRACFLASSVFCYSRLFSLELLGGVLGLHSFFFFFLYCLSYGLGQKIKVFLDVI